MLKNVCCPGATNTKAAALQTTGVTGMNSVVFEFKPIPEPAYCRLPEYMEQRHQLLEVYVEDGQCIAAFPNGKFAFPIELREKLAPLVGQTVAVLCLDGYRVREVEG